MDMLTVTQLEKIINDLRRLNPSNPGTFANCEDVNVLAELYGGMIHFKMGSIRLDAIQGKQREVLLRYGLEVNAPKS